MKFGPYCEGSPCTEIMFHSSNDEFDGNYEYIQKFLLLNDEKEETDESAIASNTVLSCNEITQNTPKISVADSQAIDNYYTRLAENFDDFLISANQQLENILKTTNQRFSQNNNFGFKKISQTFDPQYSETQSVVKLSDCDIESEISDIFSNNSPQRLIENQLTHISKEYASTENGNELSVKGYSSDRILLRNHELFDLDISKQISHARENEEMESIALLYNTLMNVPSRLKILTSINELLEEFDGNIQQKVNGLFSTASSERTLGH